jgi:hypothetical protein
MRASPSCRIPDAREPSQEKERDGHRDQPSGALATDMMPVIKALGGGPWRDNREADRTDAPERADCLVVVTNRGNARGAT